MNECSVMNEKRREEPFYVEEFAGTKLPVHTGKIMPSLSTPSFTVADKADHVRKNDCVLGVSFNGITRAYPLWIMDNVHLVNDVFDGEPLVVIHCERCSSGAAFFPMVEGQRLTFQVAGIWKMTLFLRDEQTNGFWSHSEGVAVAGPLKGRSLERHPCYQTTWEEWAKLHPETEVLLWPENKLHRDGRHGHGARDYFGRPGIRAGESLGVKPEPVDPRLPENAMVLGIRDGEDGKAYPLKEVQKNSGVVNDKLDKEPVVAWAPRFGSHLMGAFSRKLEDGNELMFTMKNGIITDAQTRSVWNYRGEAIHGELAGKKLRPLDWVFLKWHAWSPFHPDTDLFETYALLKEERLDTKPLAPVYEALREAGFKLEFDGQCLKALLPNLAEYGAMLRIDGDPFLVYRFQDSLGAAEYCYIERRAVSRGSFVLKSEPDRQFADNAQLEFLPDEKIAWSRLVENDAFLAALDSVGPESAPAGGVGLSDLCESLISSSYTIQTKQQLEGRRLPVDALNAYELSIENDPYLVYRFKDAKSAEAFCNWHGHSICAEAFVLRSDPPGQYKVKGLETVNLPSENVGWSCLLTNEGFAQALGRAVAESA